MLEAAYEAASFIEANYYLLFSVYEKHRLEKEDWQCICARCSMPLYLSYFMYDAFSVSSIDAKLANVY